MTVYEQRRRTSVDEFVEAVESGRLDPERRYELLAGEIRERAPGGRRHVACVNRLTRLFSARAAERALVSVQNGLVLSGTSFVIPDVALLRLREDFYESALPAPRDALLVVEVADTSYPKDRRLKLPLYAAAGVAELWIVRLAEARVEVFREPVGGGYGVTETIDRTGAMCPECFPGLEIEARSILG